MEIPDSLLLHYRWDDRVKGRYYKDQTFRFVSPKSLEGDTLNSIVDASIHLKGDICFPYNDWIIEHPQNGFWTAWKYERYTHPNSSYFNQHAFSNPSHISNNMFVEDESEEDETDYKQPQNPFEVPHDQWTSSLVSDWISRNDPDPKQNLILQRITHFRRYGEECRFEFLCEWKIPKSHCGPARTWVKYIDLIKVPQYLNYLKRKKWDIQSEKNKHFEEEEGNDDDDSDLDIPEVPHYTTLPPEGRRAVKTMKRIKAQETKKEHKKSQSESDTDLGPSNSEDDDEKSSEECSSDENREEIIRNPKRQKRRFLKWDPIFAFSSVEPTPRYKVKLMRRHEIHE